MGDEKKKREIEGLLYRETEVTKHLQHVKKLYVKLNQGNCMFLLGNRGSINIF
jgi:hypothetical protein